MSKTIFPKMYDKNGKELKTGQIVKIEGGYFKSDNGYFLIKHAPNDPTWLGSDCCLHKCNKQGIESTVKANVAFFPLSISINSREKRLLAIEHNKKNATIEIIDKIPSYEVLVTYKRGMRRGESYTTIVTGNSYKELKEDKNFEIKILNEF